MRWTYHDDEEPKKNEEEAKQEGLMAKLVKSRIVMITGGIDQEVAEKAIAQLLILDSDNHNPIKVVVSSPGGHVDSGYAIHDIMRFIKSSVIGIGAGWVASIGVPILLGADRDKRYSLPNTRFLLHQPSGGAGGQAADIRIEAQEIIKIRTRINKLISEETGQPEEKVARDSDRNFWMNAEEAHEYGLVSKIITHFDEAN